MFNLYEKQKCRTKREREHHRQRTGGLLVKEIILLDKYYKKAIRVKNGPLYCMFNAGSKSHSKGVEIIPQVPN